MDICNVIEKIRLTPKRTEKESILKDNDSPLLREILEYTYNPYRQYHVVKFTPQTDFKRNDGMNVLWQEFFQLLDRLDGREISGNDALNEVETFIGSMPEISKSESERQEKDFYLSKFQNEFGEFDENSSEDLEKLEKISKSAKYPGPISVVSLMRKILDRHLNIGITSNTINRCFKGLVPAFKVQLAHKFEAKRVESESQVAVEPKLDGVRCIAIVKNGHTILYSRNGKTLSDNYKRTIVADLNRLAEEGVIPKYVVFDGELMGSDFTATVSQIHRKSSVDVSSHFYHVFDWLPYNDWINHKSTLTCQETREKLEDMNLEENGNFLKLVHRDIVPTEDIKKMHDVYVGQGYEGVMIKILSSKYKFGRGHNVSKMKDFYDIDLEVVSFEEGERKYTNSLGAIIVKHGEVLVKVGSGFSDQERQQIWNNRSKFRNQIVEIRYQEETPDGSLRFPTFRGWRPDKK